MQHLHYVKSYIHTEKTPEAVSHFVNSAAKHTEAEKILHCPQVGLLPLPSNSVAIWPWANSQAFFKYFHLQTENEILQLRQDYIDRCYHSIQLRAPTGD